MTSQIRPRRSVLYMPGANPRALEKAKTLPADAVILDLEDSVAPEGKGEARERVGEAVQAGGYGAREVVIRVNALESDWGRDDIIALAHAGADAICVPKVESAAGVAAVRDAIAGAGWPPELPVWAMMETPLAILNAHEIVRAAAGDRNPLAVLVMGTNDLAKETRAVQTAGRSGLVVWLSCCVAAARAYGLDILDGVYNDYKDLDGFARECEQGHVLGMDGKTLIHPSQIGIANETFSPGEEEIAWSRKVLAAFARAENRGKGVITIDGRMVELLHAETARRTVKIADAIAERERA